jgi:hypothetical protein
VSPAFADCSHKVERQLIDLDLVVSSTATMTWT